MRKLLVPTLGILVLPCSLPCAAGAAEQAARLLSLVHTVTAEARPSESVIAQVRREDGNVYEVQVTAPAGQALDPAVVEWATGAEAESASAGPERPLDLSGYRIRVEKVANAGCSGSFSLKSKPVNLNPDKGWTFESGTAISMSVTSFPTKGDVDVAVFTGPELTVCASSFKKNQNLDFAGCVLNQCRNDTASTKLSGIVGNISSSKATYVGSYSLIFVTLP